MFTFRGSSRQFQSWSGQKSFYSSQAWLRRSVPTWISDSDLLFSAATTQNSQPFFSQIVGTQSHFGIKCPFWFALPLIIQNFFWEIKKLLAVTLLKPMRCSESPGKLGHKRTDMTQPMFWMSPIFSKRWSTMELIRAKSNVLYIPHNRCMT